MTEAREAAAQSTGLACRRPREASQIHLRGLHGWGLPGGEAAVAAANAYRLRRRRGFGEVVFGCSRDTVCRSGTRGHPRWLSRVTAQIKPSPGFFWITRSHRMTCTGFPIWRFESVPHHLCHAPNALLLPPSPRAALSSLLLTTIFSCSILSPIATTQYALQVQG